MKQNAKAKNIKSLIIYRGGSKMKKLTIVALSVILMIGLFVSCSNEVQQQEPTAYITFDGDGSRAISSTNQELPGVSELHWKYTAVKQDGGLKTGETSEQKDVNAGTGLTGSVGPLSIGSWKFMLYGYKDDTLVYQGETIETLSAGETKSIAVDVKYAGNNDNGFVKVENLTLKNDGSAVTGNANLAKLILSATRQDQEGSIEEIVLLIDAKGNFNTSANISVAPGVYQFTFTFKDALDRVVSDIQSKYILILGGQTTTLSGDVNEYKQQASFEANNYYEQFGNHFYVVMNNATGLNATQDAARKYSEDHNGIETYIYLNGEIVTGGSSINFANESEVSSRDISSSTKIANIILNLNGNTIKHESETSPALVINNEGLTLTIKDDTNLGSVTSTGKGIVVNSGNLKIEGGNISSASTALSVNSEASVEISRGNITTSNTTDVAIDNSGYFKMNGGTITASTAVKISSESSLTIIANGKLESDINITRAEDIQNTNVIINSDVSLNNNSTSDIPIISFAGGNGTINNPYIIRNASELIDSTALVEDGSYFILTEDIVINESDIQGKAKYISDCEGHGNNNSNSFNFAYGKTGFTLDLNGHTITNNVNFYGFMVTGNNTTIKNGSIYAGLNSTKNSGYNSYAVTIYAEAVNATLENLEIKGGVNCSVHSTGIKLINCNVVSGDYYAVCAQLESNVRIEGGSYTANENGIAVFWNAGSYYNYTEDGGPCNKWVNSSTISLSNDVKVIFNGKPWYPTGKFDVTYTDANGKTYTKTNQNINSSVNFKIDTGFNADISTLDQLSTAIYNGVNAKLVEDIYIQEGISKGITQRANGVLDLNGHKISSASANFSLTVSFELRIIDSSNEKLGIIESKYTGDDLKKLIHVNAGTLFLESVTIKTEAPNIYPISLNGSRANHGIVNINSSKVIGGGLASVALLDNYVDLYINGDSEISSNNGYPIAGLGNKVYQTVTVDNGYIHGSDYAMYIPGAKSSVTINGGKIEGNKTAIELRGGSLNISGGEIISNYTGEYKSVANGNGTTTTGAAVAISPHTTFKNSNPITVSISGGKFRGPVAFVQNDPNNMVENTVHDDLNIAITGGIFTSTDNTEPNAVISTHKTGFISGGTYNTNPENYINNVYSLKENDGIWTVEAPVAVVSLTDGTKKGFDIFEDAVDYAVINSGVVDVLKDTISLKTVHYPVNGSVVINANGADFGNKDLGICTYDNSKYSAQSGEINIVVNDAKNLYVWGAPNNKRPENTTINIKLNNCINEGTSNVSSSGRLIYLTEENTTNITNIELINCTVSKVDSPVYTNASGEVKITNCTFNDCAVPINFNHKASGGTLNVIIDNSCFINCGCTSNESENINLYAAPIRICHTVEGSETKITVKNSTITDTKGTKGDVLLLDDRSGKTVLPVTAIFENNKSIINVLKGRNEALVTIETGSNSTVNVQN